MVTSLSGVAGVVLLIIYGSLFLPLVRPWHVAFAGLASYLGCLAMFYAVRRGEVSKVSTMIASAIPLWILIISIAGGIEHLKNDEAIGGLLVMLAGYGLSQTGRERTKLDKQTLLLVATSSLAYGFYHSLAKASYNVGEFLPTLAWISLANFLAGAVCTIIFYGPKKIFTGFKKDPNNGHHGPTGKWAVIIGQSFGGLSALFLQWAVSLGSVFVVNAMQGMQYLFVLGITAALTAWWPNILHEDIRGKTLGKKLAWCLVLAVGVALIVL
jgi:uncharacterized membrane protein